VPEEFIVQHNTNANPPTLFLPLQYLIDQIRKTGGTPEDIRFFKNIYPRLQSWYKYFNETQVGKVPGSYRWRGRDEKTTRELNPKTLASGLDDYPRASHPTDDERHIDLRCWIALASKVMYEVGEFIGEKSDVYLSTYLYLSDPALMDNLHWDVEKRSYSDFGLDSQNVKLKRPKPNVPPGKPVPQLEKVRVVDSPPTLRFVSHFGYISLFPFLLKILDAKSPKLGHILDDLRNPELIWTDYGLRSLSKSSNFYMKYNTEHDPPYWRGPIWININYLALGALAHYGRTEGPHKDLAAELHKQLKQNLVSNMYKEYRRTGYLWEQYDDTTGHGQRGHPFTGWSALVALAMAEE